MKSIVHPTGMTYSGVWFEPNVPFEVHDADADILVLLGIATLADSQTAPVKTIEPTKEPEAAEPIVEVAAPVTAPTKSK